MGWFYGWAGGNRLLHAVMKNHGGTENGHTLVA